MQRQKRMRNTSDEEGTRNETKKLFFFRIIIAFCKFSVTVKSLKKKFKDKKFAAKCNREIIKNGVADLGMDLGDVMACCIKGMTEHKDELV